VNSDYNDARPSIRRDGRELVFDSDRPGGEGGFDLWSASRNKIADSWSDPVNLGSIINSSADEIRASLSWKAKMLVFGSNRPNGEGGSDIYFSIRD
jgi:hypothetical protein